jgi:hypothetical protein
MDVQITFGPITIHLTPNELAPKLDILTNLLQGIANMPTLIEDLVREVSESRTVSESAVTLLTGLRAALEAAVAANDLGAVAAAIADLDAQQAALAAAITANTPAAVVAPDGGVVAP